MQNNAPNNNYMGTTGNVGSGANSIINRNRKGADTIDPEEDKASNYENVSAGGTRYIVGLKGNLKFYGNQSASKDINDSLSQYSKSRGGGPLGEFADNASQGYDAMSMQDGSIDKSDHDPRNMRGQTAY